MFTTTLMILLSTDLSLTAKEIIHTYSYRFKIEVMFKKAIYNVGPFLYRFWMSNMDKVRRRDGTIYLHEKSNAYREKYFRKLRAYEVYVQLAFISQGIMQYLSVAHTRLVWTHFTGWIRTIRPNVLPSEMVVSWGLRNNLIYFLEGKPFPLCLQKFIREKTIFQEVESLQEIFALNLHFATATHWSGRVQKVLGR